VSLEITDGLVGIETKAVLLLQKLPCLRKVKLLYDDNIVDVLPELLSRSNQIEDINQ
jgi:hypothetical protein